MLKARRRRRFFLPILSEKPTFLVFPGHFSQNRLFRKPVSKPFLVFFWRETFCFFFLFGLRFPSAATRRFVSVATGKLSAVGLAPWRKISGWPWRGISLSLPEIFLCGGLPGAMERSFLSVAPGRSHDHSEASLSPLRKGRGSDALGAVATERFQDGLRKKSQIEKKI